MFIISLENKRRVYMKKNTKRLLTLTVAAFAGMYAYNRFVDSNASRKNLLKTDNGHYYKWKKAISSILKSEMEPLFS